MIFRNKVYSTFVNHSVYSNTKLTISSAARGGHTVLISYWTSAFKMAYGFQLKYIYFSRTVLHFANFCNQNEM